MSSDAADEHLHVVRQNERRLVDSRRRDAFGLLARSSGLSPSRSRQARSAAPASRPARPPRRRGSATSRTTDSAPVCLGRPLREPDARSPSTSHMLVPPASTIATGTRSSTSMPSVCGKLARRRRTRQSTDRRLERDRRSRASAAAAASRPAGTAAQREDLGSRQTAVARDLDRLDREERRRHRATRPQTNRRRPRRPPTPRASARRRADLRAGAARARRASGVGHLRPARRLLGARAVRAARAGSAELGACARTRPRGSSFL